MKSTNEQNRISESFHVVINVTIKPNSISEYGRRI